MEYNRQILQRQLLIKILRLNLDEEYYHNIYVAVTFNYYKIFQKGTMTIFKSDLNRSPFKKFGIIAGILTYLLIKRFSVNILGIEILTIDRREVDFKFRQIFNSYCRHY